MDNEADKITYSFSKCRVALFLLLCILFAILGVALIGFSFIEEGIWKWLNLIPGILFSVFAPPPIINFVRLLLIERDGLILDSDGIYDNTSVFRTDKYLWRDIDSIRIQKTIISIWLKDANKYLNGKNFIERWLGERLFYLSYQPDISIPLLYLDSINRAQLSKHIEDKFLAALKRQNI